MNKQRFTIDAADSDIVPNVFMANDFKEAALEWAECVSVYFNDEIFSSPEKITVKNEEGETKEFYVGAMKQEIHYFATEIKDVSRHSNEPDGKNNPYRVHK